MIERVFNYPPRQIDSLKQNQENHQSTKKADFDQTRVNFNELLKSRIQNQSGLSFSAHASNRLEQRNISLTDSDRSLLENAVNKLSEKGGRESLIRVNNISYVVNIANRTVITAMDDQESSDNVFTNIDSAMIVN